MLIPTLPAARQRERSKSSSMPAIGMRSKKRLARLRKRVRNMLVNLGFMLILVGGLYVAGSTETVPWIGLAFAAVGFAFLLVPPRKQRRKVPSAEPIRPQAMKYWPEVDNAACAEQRHTLDAELQTKPEAVLAFEREPQDVS